LSRRPKNPVTAAEVAAKLLGEIATELRLESAGATLDMKEVREASRVTPAALKAAAKIVASNPQRFDAYDAASLNDAAEYTVAMLPLLGDAQSLVRALHKSVYSKRLPAARHALALYALLKGMERNNPDAKLSAMTDDLGEKLLRGKKKRKMSVEEKAARSFVKKKAKRIAKLEAQLAREKGESAPLPAPPAPGDVSAQ
jgi:hypothetical protein